MFHGVKWHGCCCIHKASLHSHIRIPVTDALQCGSNGSVCWHEQYFKPQSAAAFLLPAWSVHVHMHAGSPTVFSTSPCMQLVLHCIACSQYDEVHCRVANELGAGNPRAAYHVCNLGLGLVLAATCCLSLPILIFRCCLDSTLYCSLAHLPTKPPLTHSLTHLLTHPTPSLTHSQTCAHSPTIHLPTQHTHPTLTLAGLREDLCSYLIPN